MAGTDPVRSDDRVLDIVDLSVAYGTPHGELAAVQGISFRVGRGETLGLVGESGCGKSTIAFATVGFLGVNGRVSSGSIRFQGQELVGCAPQRLREIRGNRISMVYQDPMQALNPVLRVGEQLSEVLTAHQSISRAEAWGQSMAMLRRVYMPDPEVVMNRYPHQLSGGQQQRTVIAMAMLNRPALLIMDEPTTALDVTVEAAVLDLVEDLKKDFDAGIIYITHNLGVIARVSDRLAVMYAGEIVEEGAVGQVFEDPRHPYTQGLLRCVPRLETSHRQTRLYNIEGRVPALGERPEEQCVFGPRCGRREQVCREGHPQFAEIDSGHKVRCWRADRAGAFTGEPPEPGREARRPAATETLVSLEHLKIYYEQKSRSVASLFGLGARQYVRALDDVTLQIQRGSTLGVVGESGCGKSTLAKGIIGLEQIWSGRAEFLELDLTRPLARRSLRLVRRIQMVFQNPDSTLNPSWVVGRQIARPLRRLRRVAARNTKVEVRRLLEAVRLDAGYYARYPRQLSGGEKQRIGIARALASDPELLICDEPVSALDVSVQAAVLNLLKDIQAQRSNTMVFIAHDLSVVRFFADFIVVMYLGQIAEYGPTERIFAPPFHPYTEALLSAVPVPDPTAKRPDIRLAGEVPSSLNPPEGCRFHTRCPRRGLLPDSGAICSLQAPPARRCSGGHIIFCHHGLDTLAAVQEKTL